MSAFEGPLKEMTTGAKAEDRKAGADAIAKAVAAAGVFDKDVAATIVKMHDLIKDDDKKFAKAREGICFGVEGIAKALGEAGSPLFAPMHLAVLRCCSDKSNPCKKAAELAWRAIVENSTRHATVAIIESCVQAMEAGEKWWTMVAACESIKVLADKHPDQVENCLPEIIPGCKPLLGDTKKEVIAAAESTLEKTINLVDNRDILPLIPHLIAALKDPSLVHECIHKLAGTTFVAIISRGPLAAIVPLMVWGFREKDVATRRLCAKIIGNMSKLVDNQVEAMPFLPELIPALEKLAENTPDPEARGVMEETAKQLNGIKLRCTGLEYTTDKKRVIKTLKKELGEIKKGGEAALDFTAACIASLVDNFEGDEDEWATVLTSFLGSFVDEAKLKAAAPGLLKTLAKKLEEDDEDDEDAAATLCDCTFTLAYGSKILLHNTKMKLLRGKRYGLLGQNDSGKTTLMKAISMNQVEGFPDSSTVRTVFVEADIVGEQSHLTCCEYVLADPKIVSYGVGEDAVRNILVQVGFAAKQGGGTAVDDGVSTLSGGWRMKLALARAMLQKADILLLDEPTNHLDVMNVRWTLDYLKSLVDVTCIIVSHDAKLLNEVTTNIMQIKDYKLKFFKGNLTAFVERHPEAQSFFEMKKTKLSFKFPQPGYIEGVKSKGKALMKMVGCDYTYPGNTRPTIVGITVQCSLSSRVALLGPNGAGKSTLVKLLVGENEPDKNKGTTWCHPACRFAYVAQHAFTHIEDHLDKTPNEYIRWRYESGEDKEAIEKDTMKDNADDLAKQAEDFLYEWKDEVSGKFKSDKRRVKRLTYERRNNKDRKCLEYKIIWFKTEIEDWASAKQLNSWGWAKHVKTIDEKEAAKQGMYIRALTKRNVEEHLADIGLAAEYGTHFRLSALSGGQKVKVVIAAAMWNQPHILILDEPTNYLDRESLGALSNAIESYEGGVVMITHNNEFCSALCPETWILEKGDDMIARIETKGDADWMKQKESEVQTAVIMTEMIDGAGNVTKLGEGEKLLDRKEKKRIQKDLKKAIKAGDQPVIDELQELLDADDLLIASKA
jgi:elongation factor 3